MVLFTACGFVALAFYMLSVRRTVARPINDLLWAFDRISEGRLQTRLEPSYTDEFDRLSRHFNRMTAQLAGLIEKDYKQTILLQDAKMKHLQAQINPHFLYNSFYLLSHLVKMEDQEAAEKLSRYLGNYFRYITDQSRNVLPLQEEYDHAVIYLSIQLMRFGHRVLRRNRAGTQSLCFAGRTPADPAAPFGKCAGTRHRGRRSGAGEAQLPLGGILSPHLGGGQRQRFGRSDHQPAQRPVRIGGDSGGSCPEQYPPPAGDPLWRPGLRAFFQSLAAGRAAGMPDRETEEKERRPWIEFSVCCWWMTNHT